MTIPGSAWALAAGVGLGAAVAVGYLGQPRLAVASAVDRSQDFVMTTGAVGITARSQIDGVWLLDYRSGKLLGTVIDKVQGKIVGWAEVDLVKQFKVTPHQDVHFMMVTGWVSQGSSALYVAETTTGQFGVYSMTAGPNGSGVAIREHDMTTFRRMAPGPDRPTGPGLAPGLPPAAALVPPGGPGVPPGVPLVPPAVQPGVPVGLPGGPFAPPGAAVVPGRPVGLGG